MTKRLLFALLLTQIVYGCLDSRATNTILPEGTLTIADSVEVDDFTIDSMGVTLEERFIIPERFKRVKEEEAFSSYLRKLPLFPLAHEVRYYNGNIKPKGDVYCSVIDLPIGKRDRHQCADAVMNVRAHFLYNSERYEEIHFNFSNGFRADYKEWRKGKRIKVDGNTVSYYQSNNESTSYGSFLDYLQTVYAYAGTYSLEKELVKVNIEDIQPGDVFIKGGFPGHAILVLDVVRNDVGKKKFMLAQSYMPAQEMQILINPMSESGSTWYDLDACKYELITPEWIFSSDQLKRFPNE